jgi:hypothetical protein
MYDEDMLGAPCIRGLERFKKTGCPGAWDKNTNKGCPACMIGEYEETDSGNKKIKKVRLCIDIWDFKFKFWHQSRLSGIQDAVLSLRNASCEADPSDPFNDNKARPKASPELTLLGRTMLKIVELATMADNAQLKLAMNNLEKKVTKMEFDSEQKQIEASII